MTFPADDPRHGTLNGYNNLRCRCQPCRDANAAWQAMYMRGNTEQKKKARQRDRRRRGLSEAHQDLLEARHVLLLQGVQDMTCLSLEPEPIADPFPRWASFLIAFLWVLMIGAIICTIGAAFDMEAS